MFGKFGAVVQREGTQENMMEQELASVASGLN